MTVKLVYLKCAKLQFYRIHIKHKSKPLHCTRKFSFLLLSEEKLYIAWDNIISGYFQKRSHCIAWENPNFEKNTFQR